MQDEDGREAIDGQLLGGRLRRLAIGTRSNFLHRITRPLWGLESIPRKQTQGSRKIEYCSVCRMGVTLLSRPVANALLDGASRNQSSG